MPAATSPRSAAARTAQSGSLRCVQLVKRQCAACTATSGSQPARSAGFDLLQAELLKARRVEHRGVVRSLEPVPRRGGGGVAPGVQRLARCRPPAPPHREPVALINVLLPTPLAPSSKVTCPASSGAATSRVRRGVVLERGLEHRHTHAAIRLQPLARRIGLGQVGLVEQHLRADAGMRGGDQRAREQRLVPSAATAATMHEQAIDVGGERLAAPAVLPPQQACAAATPLSMTPPSPVMRHSTRSPTTQSTFLPRRWHSTRCRSAVSTTKCRPWAPTTRPVFNSTDQPHQAARAR